MKRKLFLKSVFSHSESGYHRIFLRTTYTIMVCLIIPVLVCIYGLQYKSYLTEKHNYDAVLNNTLRLQSSILSECDNQIRTNAMRIASNKDLQIILSKNTWNLTINSVHHLSNLRIFFQTLSNASSYLDQSLCMLDYPLAITSDGTAMTMFSSYSPTLVLNTTPFLGSILNEGNITSTTGWYYSVNPSFLFYSMPVSNKTNKEATSGTIFLVTDLAALKQDLASSLSENQAFLLTDTNGQMILSSLPRAVINMPNGSTDKILTIGNTKYQFQSTVISSMNCILYTLQDLDVYQANLGSFIFALIFSSLVVLILGFVSAVFLSKKICKPYDIIINLLKEPYVNARENYESQYARNDDLGIIRTLIQSNKYQIYATQNELESREKLLRDAQSAALQAQINPHFLYNTLDAINWAVNKDLPPDNNISAAICDLARLYAVCTDIQNPLVPLHEEIEHVKLYLSIQEFRFQCSFHVQFDIPDDLQEAKVINLILQPLVENSFHYGLNKAEDPGSFLVRISAHSENNRLTLSVIDNGKGFLPQTLKVIQSTLQNPLGSKDHVGLINIHKRIVLTFGEEYGLNLSSIPFVETKITITLPLQK